MKLKWSDDICVGVEDIDGQHKKLFDILNDLMEAMENQAGGEEVERVIRFLEEYVISHFDNEETLMKDSGYPDRDDHIKLHREFTDSLNELKRRYARHGPTETVMLILQSNLCNWLFRHIMMIDRQLGRFLIENVPGALQHNAKA